MSGQSYQHRHRVTYADCTVGNHVYYARYLHFLEAARGEMFRSLGTTFQQWQDQEFILPPVECQLRYLAPARYDDVLLIEVWVESMERIRLTFGYRILHEDGRELVRAASLHVCTNLRDRPRRLPEPMVKGLQEYLRPRPAAVGQGERPTLTGL